MMLHAADVVKQGFRKIVIHTGGTDVVVYLTVATVVKFHRVDTWVTFAVGANFHYLPAHEIS